jgi:hypothetical protein
MLFEVESQAAAALPNAKRVSGKIGKENIAPDRSDHGLKHVPAFVHFNR